MLKYQHLICIEVTCTMYKPHEQGVFVKEMLIQYDEYSSEILDFDLFFQTLCSASLCNASPCKSQFVAVSHIMFGDISPLYIVKIGFTGVNISIFAPKHRLRVLIRTAFY